ncbi:hypothetical protein SAMN00017405_0687 [Desulfonispora thiosulfatigenes DSM 11270]|uniref:Uncharacterized protein n=1 Tax=Desulfonispora thiosulfatigenes DSM 11270 TaxID=656914 RepID=A0A1W1V934_DESTI|nr:hypothetical protein [Desulfonispora thiosulfatigenes]SMB89959.1 hypothetical protein SAMN00017405_0687 [Desulfonispora thiosulfatigenes DSM 11270]
MVVNKHFLDELSKVNDRDKAFKDTKNGGDVAFRLGFKYKDKDSKEVIAKDRWQSYTLATMLQNPDKGMQEEIYKTMVVAKKLGLFSGEESRWDEPISKAEGILLMVSTHLAKNDLHGYLSTAEYGKINVDKFKTATDKEVVLGVNNDGKKYGEDWVEADFNIESADPNKELPDGITLLDAKEMIEWDCILQPKNIIYLQNTHLESLGARLHI